jgi:transposase
MIKRGNSPARLELIKKVASLSVEGLTTSEIAKELNVTYSKVRRLLSASENLPMGCLSETAQGRPPSRFGQI